MHQVINPPASLPLKPSSRIGALAGPVRLPARLALHPKDRARSEALFCAVSDLAALLPCV